MYVYVYIYTCGPYINIHMCIYIYVYIYMKCITYVSYLHYISAILRLSAYSEPLKAWTPRRGALVPSESSRIFLGRKPKKLFRESPYYVTNSQLLKKKKHPQLSPFFWEFWIPQSSFGAVGAWGKPRGLFIEPGQARTLNFVLEYIEEPSRNR